MQLYEIDVQITSLLNAIAIDEQTGEILEGGDLLTELNDLQVQETEKLEGLAVYVKSLKSDADAIKQEEAALKARRTAIERKNDRISFLLSDYLQSHGHDKFSTPRCAISFRASEQVEIYDFQAFMEYAKNAETLFVRVELSPQNGDPFSPIDTWVYGVDQDILPEWYG